MENFVIGVTALVVGILIAFWKSYPRQRGSYVATFRPSGDTAVYEGVGKEKAKKLAKATLRINGSEGFLLRRI